MVPFTLTRGWGQIGSNRERQEEQVKTWLGLEGPQRMGQLTFTFMKTEAQEDARVPHEGRKP